MGTALVEGAIRSGAVAAADVTGVDPYQGAREGDAGGQGDDGSGGIEGGVKGHFLRIAKMIEVASHKLVKADV